MAPLTSLYPKAFQNRVSKNDAMVRKARFGFLKAAGNNFIILQLLFLGLFCYVFGSLFAQTSHTHNLNILFVDYDGGAIGHAVREAYTALKGKSFPSLIERSPADHPSTADVWQAVCHADYWAAIYVVPGASDRLEEALSAGQQQTPSYNNRDVMAYVWNEALYAPTIDASISSNIQLLSNAARIAYTTGRGTGNTTTAAIISSSPSVLSVLAEPWQLESLNIQPTPQGSRAIYNTIVIVLILIQEFFYLGTINGLYAQFKLYTRLSPYRIAAVRNLNSLVYTLAGTLCVTGAIWAFKAGWDVDGGRFALCWVTFWLFAHANFLTLDVFTIWLPAPYVPMALVSWIICNVTSVLLPFELSPGFYQVGYLFPAHGVYQVLTDIWSGGCNPRLGYALPVLFAWEAVGLALSVLGVFRRCHFATLGEEVQAREFKEKLDAAVAVEVSRLHALIKLEGKKKREEEDAEKEDRGEMRGRGEAASSAGRGDVNQEEEEELEQARERQRNHVDCSFGPSFDLAFHGNNGAE
ncbi:hypothetical protein QBC42DRAFT_224019 [Cladorrhinum samala]|uniref:DUF3533 domain-containing protein n=1 Tax=Cladorrhinum samala TaxID=585594 RepID=A0AAV9HQ65_9PEZI|nr:hypothetical protein QBC42DRAFT_224019 [Cladorrhinum samala]